MNILAFFLVGGIILYQLNKSKLTENSPDSTNNPSIPTSPNKPDVTTTVNNNNDLLDPSNYDFTNDIVPSANNSTSNETQLRVDFQMYGFDFYSVSDSDIKLNLYLKFTNKTAFNILIQYLDLAIKLNHLDIGKLQTSFNQLSLTPGAEQLTLVSVDLDKNAIPNSLWQQIWNNDETLIFEFEGTILSNGETLPMNIHMSVTHFVDMMNEFLRVKNWQINIES